MHVTRFTDLALRVLVQLDSFHPDGSTVAELSKALNAPRNHLSKVAHRLAKLGYIVSRKGKSGGIALAGDIRGLRLGDLFQQLEPDFRLDLCEVGKKCGGAGCENCRLIRAFDEARAAMISELNKKRVADVIVCSRIPERPPSAL